MKYLISKNQFIYFIIGAVILTSCKTTSKQVKVAQEKKPNIIFILVDDLGYADVGFNGSTYFETPALDSLAKESLVFNNAYMYPTCSPSRTAIFTGKQSFRTGIYTVPVLEKGSAEENIFSRWTVEKKHPIYAEPLAEAGYKAIHIGKWHIVGPYPKEELKMEFPLKQKLTQPDPGTYDWAAVHKTPEVQKYYPEGRGFIKNVAGTYRGDPALEVGGYKSVSGGYWAPFSNPFIEQKPTDNWLTDRLTDEAIEFIDIHKEEPFFINLNYYAVHAPVRARSAKLLEKYLNKPVDSITGQGIATNEKRREHYAGYASMVESVDDNIKRIVSYLDTNNLRENTMIIVTSDNGYNGGQSKNDLLRGSKGYIYEGGIRVPMLVNWPGKVRARRTNTAVSCLDFFPTYLDVSGINDYEGTLDGNSIAPLFQEDTSDLNARPLFWHIASQWKHGTCSVIRKGDYKLIQFLATGKVELYNLVKDPKEASNLAGQEEEVTKNMLDELLAWRGENEVPLPPNSPLDQ
ncbi:sulfatase [uncultured Maribacter sp.]|uniref:sulfatase n=1 Tax=uncultured Maribacter sp. TaxID=431308 RepID=UPI00260C6EF3|nr:sulfatase [uncultured Maribacter sp.]